MILEEVLEAENRDVFGREYNEHGVEPDWGYPNGTCKGKLKTAECMIEYSVPQIAERDRPFKSVIRVPFWGDTAALDDPNIGGAPRSHLDPDRIAKEISEGAMERLGAEGAADAWSSLDDNMRDVRGQFRYPFNNAWDVEIPAALARTAVTAANRLQCLTVDPTYRCLHLSSFRRFQQAI